MPLQQPFTSRDPTCCSFLPDYYYAHASLAELWLIWAPPRTPNLIIVQCHKDVQAEREHLHARKFLSSYNLVYYYKNAHANVSTFTHADVFVIVYCYKNAEAMWSPSRTLMFLSSYTITKMLRLMWAPAHTLMFLSLYTVIKMLRLMWAPAHTLTLLIAHRYNNAQARGTGYAMSTDAELQTVKVGR